MNTGFGSGQEDNEPGFAELLRSYIRRAGMTYEQLAEAANIPFDTLRNWIKGAANPRKWQDVLRLAAALALTASQADSLLRAAHHPRLTDLLRTHAKDESLADWRAALAAETVKAHGSGLANNQPDERPIAPATVAIDTITPYSGAPSASVNGQEIAVSADDASLPHQVADANLPTDPVPSTQAATKQNGSLAIGLAEQPAPHLPPAAPSLSSAYSLALSSCSCLSCHFFYTTVQRPTAQGQRRHQQLLATWRTAPPP